MTNLLKGLSLVALLFLSNMISSAKNPTISDNSTTYYGSAYKAGSVVIRVKAEYRNACTSTDVSVPSFRQALAKISASRIMKKFPLILEPKEKTNRFGKKLIDLSLVYEVQYSPVVKIEEAIRILNSCGILEYAEPLYIHNLDFTPNDPSVASQYHLGRISAYAAWDVWTGDTNVVIGIVDSGTDWDHPDLQGNIKYNWADPIDNIDNDSDGYVDNFRGWDVSENDNDPMVVSSTHGSHVSGCANAVTNNGVGVAAPAYNCRFLPVKCALDVSTSTIDNGYDGIVYAADHGANIINCSWGRSGFKSQFEQQTIDYATFNHDALIVAAAGNDGLEISHYPSSYDNVISVGSTTSSDSKSSFSNYNTTVDVCAPGTNILATLFNNTYGLESGTSMASPIAAGCAAMIKSRFSAFNAAQVGEQLRATSDNIYTVGGNNAYFGKLGHGRVNLFKAVTDSVSPGVVNIQNNATDGNDNVFVPGDTLSIASLLENLLRPTTNLTCSLSTVNSFVQILQPNYTAGVVGTLDTVSNYNLPFRVFILPSAPTNTDVQFKLKVTDGTWSDNFLFNIIVNVDYVNITVNNVSTSITSKSLLGYNQTNQGQGLGFTFNGSTSILYDMGLMIGATGTQVSDNTRGVSGNDADFAPAVNVSSQEPGTVSDFDVSGTFRDNGSTSIAPLNIVVNQHAYAWIAAPDDNYVMVQYYIKNNGTSTLNNLYAGLFADWDIPAYANNKCSTDQFQRMGYVWSTDSSGIYGGVKLLSHTGGFNHYALDNTANNGGIDLTDGFDSLEKYTALTTFRSDAGIATTTGNDVLSVVSSGGFNLAVGDSVEVAFALIAGRSLSSIQQSANAAQDMYDAKFVGIIHVGNATGNRLFQSYPNPADREVRIEFSLSETQMTDITIYNLQGKKMKTILSEKTSSGRYSINADVHALPAGNYIYRIVSGDFVKSLPLTIIH